MARDVKNDERPTTDEEGGVLGLGSTTCPSTALVSDLPAGMAHAVWDEPSSDCTVENCNVCPSEHQVMATPFAERWSTWDGSDCDVKKCNKWTPCSVKSIHLPCNAKPREDAAPGNARPISTSAFLRLVKDAYASEPEGRSSNSRKFMANWMSEMRSLLETTGATLIDLTLPGTHDVITCRQLSDQTLNQVSRHGVDLTVWCSVRRCPDDLTTSIQSSDVTEVFGEGLDANSQAIYNFIMDDLTTGTSCMPQTGTGLKSTGCVFRQLAQVRPSFRPPVRRPSTLDSTSVLGSRRRKDGRSWSSSMRAYAFSTCASRSGSAAHRARRTTRAMPCPTWKHTTHMGSTRCKA